MKVVWSLQEWRKQDRIEIKIPAKTTNGLREKILAQVVDEREATSWAWKVPAKK